MVRGKAMMKKTMNDQEFWINLLKYLQSHIAEERCINLLLHTDDKEVRSNFSPYDIKHVGMKARHVADALKAMIHATTNNKPITWQQSCEIACKENY